MPANQFFTDWVTGDIITADKLNTMKNEVQPYLGYTPVNKAGDTMTGDLNITAGGVFRIDLSDSYNTGIGLVRLRTSDGKLQWGIGHLGVPGANNAGNNLAIWRYDNNGNYLGQALQISRADGTTQARYDHQNRFVVQKYVDNVIVPANSDFAIAAIRISVPTGKALYLRRVRWELYNTSLRPRVSSSNTWTGTSYFGDSALDEQIITSSGSFTVYVSFVNTSSSSQATSSGAGIWAELEIR